MRAAPASADQFVRLLASGALALSVVACAGPSAVQTSPGSSNGSPAAATGAPALGSAADVENLRQRAAAFWAARVAVDPNAQWALLEPRGQGRMNAMEYAGVPKVVKYLAYQVEDATLNGYFATVRIRLIVQPVLPTASSRPMPPSAVVINDRWVRVRGTWYRSLEQEDPSPSMATQR